MAKTRRTTIKQIASIAGVSPSTVSRALRDDPSASRKTRLHIQELAQKLSYFPDSIATGLRYSTTKTIGVVFSDLRNPFYTEVLSEIGEIANARGYALIVTYSQYDVERERRSILSLLSKRVDGVIISPIEEDRKNMALLANSHMSTVVIDAEPFMDEASFVYCDHRKGMSLAVQYLLQNGHRDILLMSGPKQDRIKTKCFMESYRETLRGHGIVFGDDRILITDVVSIQAGYEEFKKLMADGAKESRTFSAIIATSDLLAVGIYKAAAERGITIPDQCSIVGYDDIEFTGALCPPLTTIHQPRKRIGRTSTELLLSEIEQQKVPERVMFEPHIVVRGSVSDISSGS
jgi:DNA-binding LacI/PurR family transcriptional regulator